MAGSVVKTPPEAAAAADDVVSDAVDVVALSEEPTVAEAPATAA